MEKVYFILVLSAALLLAGCTAPGNTSDKTGSNQNGNIGEEEATSDKPGSEQGVDIEEDTDVSVNGEDVDEENIVKYTSDGFSPQTITIEKGETVKWVSEGPSMWVASDRHPTHTEYSGTSRSEHCNNPDSETFDSCETKETYSFTFDKKGEWDYHDHVAPTKGGTVIVE